MGTISPESPDNFIEAALKTVTEDIKVTIRNVTPLYGN